MKTYLSFGGGVNSVATMLLMLDGKWEFEATFVNHGGDWPETYEYFDMFQKWLADNGHQEITVLTPQVRTRGGRVFTKIYDYYYHKRVTPVVISRGCTSRWKVEVVAKYFERPNFNCLGFDYGELHRASTTSALPQSELRFPLIEHEIDREGCKELIKSKGLPVPVKSGCFFCPFQKISDVKKLRREHPDLFCKTRELENRYVQRRTEEGKEPLYIYKKPIDIVVEEDQLTLFDDLQPPCYCMR